MTEPNLPLDQVIQGDCIRVLDALPEKSIDLVFADPPYNLQLQNDLWRPNMTRVDAVNDDWDKFDDLDSYDRFTRRWLGACRRVLKENGTIWVIGTYHNIFRVGAIMQNMGFWFLNDVIWIKTNPMPNFRGVRFSNAHETLIWASKSRGAKYTFNHHAMKSVNNDLQMRSDWVLPLCTGQERIKINGKKAHSTQKPEALLYRIILAASDPGDLVLDPFFGTGTTGAVAKKLHRHWLGIEKDEGYVRVAKERIDQIKPQPYDEKTFDVRDRRRATRIPFAHLLENSLLQPGQQLYFRSDRERVGVIKPDGKLRLKDGFEGSIHETGKYLSKGGPCNGWDHWFFGDENGNLQPVDKLRQKLRDNE